MDAFSKEVRNKVVLDLILKPTTVLPVFLGFVFLLLAEIGGSRAVFAGLSLCLFGFGSFLVNIMFNLEKMREKIVEQMDKEEEQKFDVYLKALYAELVVSDSKRDETAFNNLNSFYRVFKRDLKKGEISFKNQEMLEQIDEAYKLVIKQLSKQLEMWKVSSKLASPSRSKILKERDIVLTSIEQSVEFIIKAIEEIRILGLSKNEFDLERIQKDLDAQIKVAKATENRLVEMEKGFYLEK